jgi:hypothetical protein
MRSSETASLNNPKTSQPWLQLPNLFFNSVCVSRSYFLIANSPLISSYSDRKPTKTYTQKHNFGTPLHQDSTKIAVCTTISSCCSLINTCFKLSFTILQIDTIPFMHASQNLQYGNFAVPYMIVKMIVNRYLSFIAHCTNLLSLGKSLIVQWQTKYRTLPVLPTRLENAFFKRNTSYEPQK